jgi:hypothetical protein
MRAANDPYGLGAMDDRMFSSNSTTTSRKKNKMDFGCKGSQWGASSYIK